MDQKPSDSTEKFEKALEDQQHEKYILKLYIAGNTSKSAQAIVCIREICETHLQGRYELDVIDISQQPELLRDQQILATPTLIKQLPKPLRHMVGDLTRTERILVGLDIHPLDGGSAE